MAEELNEAAVERRLERLREAWGSFPVDREAETAPAERFDALLAEARDGYTGGGYVWAVREPGQAPPLSPSMADHATQDADRVLLVLGREREWWAPPGGGREDGETYEDAAVREVAEETGVDVDLTGVARAERWTSTPHDGREVRVHTLFVCFEGRYAGGHIEVQPGELNGAAWFRELPARVHPIAEPLAEEWAGGRSARASSSGESSDGGLLGADG